MYNILAFVWNCAPIRFNRNIKLSSFHVDQILLFVSDGSNDGGDPLEVIRDENQQLNNRVVIHTYGIGTGEW